MLNIKTLAPSENRDLGFVIINLLTYRIFTRFPLLFPKTAGNAATLSAIYSGVISFAIIFLISSLACKKVKGNLIDAASFAFGKTGKYIVSVIILIYLALSAVLAIGEFSYIAKSISFTTAPLWFIVMFFAGSVLCCSTKSQRTVIRLHGVFMPIVILGILLLIISTLYKGSFSNIFPLAGNGFEKLSANGLMGIIFYTDIILFTLLLPKDKSVALPKLITLGAAISLLINVLFVLAFNLSVPYPVSAEGQYPLYLLMKEVYYGRFFQRIDAIILFISSLSGMLYLALNARLFTLVLSQAFKVKKTGVLVIIYTILLFSTSLFGNLIPSQFMTYLIFIFGFTGLLLVPATLFFARRKPNNEKT